MKGFARFQPSQQGVRSSVAPPSTSSPPPSTASLPALPSFALSLTTASVAPPVSALQAPVTVSLSQSLAVKRKRPVEDDLFDRALSTSLSASVKREEKPAPVVMPQEVVISKEYTSSLPPLDWSLKSKLHVTSAHPLFWMALSKAVDTSHALMDFVNSSANNAHATSNDLHDDDLYAAFHQSTLYWIYPECCVSPKNPLMRLSKEGSVKDQSVMSTEESFAVNFMYQRWIQWEETFHSLYHRLLSGHCRYFYYYSAQLLVLFLAASESQNRNGAGQIQAIIAKSTRALRATLTKHKVSFVAPFLEEKENKTNFSNADAELLARQEQRKPGSTRSLLVSKDDPTDNTPASLVIVRGRKDVHLLFDLLLNFNKRNDDVPTLYGGSPFLNSSLKALKIIKANEAPRESENAPPYAVDLVGVVMPFALAEIVRILQRTQHGDFNVTLSSLHGSVANNINMVTDVPQLSEYAINNDTADPLVHHAPLIRSLAQTKSDVFRSCPSVRRVQCKGTTYTVILGND